MRERMHKAKGRKLGVMMGLVFLGLLSQVPAMARGEDEEKGDFHFLPRAKISIESALVTPNDLDNRLILRRRTHARLFQWDGVFLDLMFLGEDIFASTPVQINHEFDYLRLGYATPWGSAILFWHHRCNNTIGIERRNDIHWNDLGVGFVSHTGFEEERPGQVSWKISLSRMFMLSKNEYEWTGDLYFRANFGDRSWGPYFALNLPWVFDDRGIVFSPSAEIGAQVFFNNGFFLSAFVRWEYLRDGENYKGRSLNVATIGIQVGKEVLVPDEEKEAWQKGEDMEGAKDAVLRIFGGYAHVATQDFGYFGEARIEVTPPLRWFGHHRFDLTLFTGITTPQNDMFPNSILVRFRPVYCIALGLHELKIGYGYSRREVTGEKIEDLTTREAHEGAVSLHLKPPQTDRDRSAPSRSSEFAFLFRLRGRLDFRVFFLTRNFDYWGEMEGAVGMDLAQWDGFTVYSTLQAKQLLGHRPPTGFAVEVGLRLAGLAGRSALYFKVQRNIDRLWIKDSKEQAMIGLRLEF